MRSPALLAGAAMGAFLANLMLLGILLHNPWFMDAPCLWILFATGPAAVIMAGIALLLRRLTGRLPARLSTSVLFLSVLAVPALARWPRPSSTGDTRILVFGLDGATFDILDWLGDDLPHLAAMQTEGVRADLMSMEPMFSPLLWTTMATGKVPEEHGIHGFRVQYGDCRVPQFWEILGAQGWTLGIYKWMVSYPPMEVPGFMVPAWLASGPETWPEDLGFVKEMELSRRLKRKKIAATRGTAALLWDGVLHGLRWTTLVEAARVMLTERIQGPDPLRSQKEGQLLKVRIDRDVAIWSIHHWNPALVTFTDYASDALSHKFWKFSAPGHDPTVSRADVDRWGATLAETYAQADAVLGELRDAVGPQARVVVVSDHGFTAFGTEQDDLGRFWEPLTETLRGHLLSKVGPVEVSRMGHKLVVTVTGDGDMEVLESALQALIQASTGEPLYRWEPVDGDPRSLGLTLRDERVTPERLTSDQVGDLSLARFVSLTEPDSGVHAARGVFLAAGPGLGAGVRLVPLSLLDVSPILLAMAGIPAGQDMVGHVPDGLFQVPPKLPPAPQTWDGVAASRRLLLGQEGVNEAALKALGYIDG